MSLTIQDLKNTESELLRLSREASREAGHPDDATHATLARQIELAKPILKYIVEDVCDLAIDVGNGGTLRPEDLGLLLRVCQIMIAIHQRTLANLNEVESQGNSIANARELRDLVRRVGDMMEPVMIQLGGAQWREQPSPVLRDRAQESRLSNGESGFETQGAALPSPPSPLEAESATSGQPELEFGHDPIGEALDKLWTMRRGVPVKTVPGSIRLPDPLFETGEGPAPFDLPLPGKWRPVKTRPGKIRLPDPIDFEEI